MLTLESSDVTQQLGVAGKDRVSPCAPGAVIGPRRCPPAFPSYKTDWGAKCPRSRGASGGRDTGCADGLPVGCNPEVAGGHLSIHVIMLRHNTCEMLALKCVIDREAVTQGDRSVRRRLGSGWEGDSWGGGSPTRKCPRAEGHWWLCPSRRSC